MEFKRYQESDCSLLVELFYNTVYNVNKKDYSKEQLDVWATGKEDLKIWNDSLHKHFTLVALIDGTILGFGDITSNGYLDRLFVHHEYQGKGIATELCSSLEKFVQGNITTFASVTAKPFFVHRGYKVIQEQQVERQGVLLKNYLMIKHM